ncbi:TetR/AcrR family transcriptional regulator [Gordonia crocea]|uniref:Transcriptional regulator AcuR n=1 Tax=Gordonia crocea TaxID=589162 RepID=A0A7M3STU1_9ACTN|nr:TetR/AcrR family transcriptional regulator [Gordonia crocea]GED96065.1 transcriptional regulator AcuR [Gordonia crocea]
MPRDGSATRIRILDAAERLVIDSGYAATSIDQVIAAAGSSKGSFFHHFSSKADLAEQLVRRYAEADVGVLQEGLDVVAGIDDPRARLLAFMAHFEDHADEVMGSQSSCLYVAVLTERQLVGSDTAVPILGAVRAWRQAVADLLRGALGDSDHDVDALADHLFVTFEGAFILCRATGDPGHMRRQLSAVRVLYEALTSQSRSE